MARKINIISQWAFVTWCTILLGLAVFFHLNTGEWQDAFYFDGDNITLALAMKSIVEGENFRWVFSSQSFIFPEGPLFALSYLITGDFKIALLLNTYINVGLITLLVFLIAQHIYAFWKPSLLSTVFFILLLILSFNLEYKPDINASTIVTLILFNTYYVGVILISLLLIWLYGYISVMESDWRILIASSIIICSGLALASNPLFLLQFIAPSVLIGSTLLTSRHFRRCSLWVLITCLVGVLFGYAVRSLLSNYTAASVNSYISLDRISSALNFFIGTVNNSISDPVFSLLWSFWFLLFLIHSTFYVNYIRRQNTLSFTFVFFHAFCIASPLITLAGVILTGNHLTRYLIPVPFFTLLGFAMIAPRVFKANLSSYFIPPVLLLGTLLTYQSYLSVTYDTPNAVSNIECFSNYAKGKNSQFIGSFVTSRYLNLYSELDKPIYQVNKELRPVDWLSNRYEHDSDNIDHVIVDKRNFPVLLTTADVEGLGTPDDVQECHDFYIYRYEQATIGYKSLNQRIRE